VVTLVEQNRRTAALISANARLIGFTKAQVVCASVAATLLRPPSAPYDVVFLDPPYPTPADEVDDALKHLGADWLVPGAMVVVERSSRTRPPVFPDGFTDGRERKYGETTLWYGHAARP
jgi:16S rRNA (guanine966-N2)-methyltransferase